MYKRLVFKLNGDYGANSHLMHILPFLHIFRVPCEILLFVVMRILNFFLFSALLQRIFQLLGKGIGGSSVRTAVA